MDKAATKLLRVSGSFSQALGHRYRLADSILAIALLAPCASAAETARLVVVPTELSLTGPTDTAQCIATLELPDGKRQDVTHRVAWTSDNAQVLRVTNGRVTPHGNGSGSISVALADAPGGSLSAKVSATVAGQEIVPTISFRRDVEPILTKYGCNAGGCHGKLAGQNGFRLSLFAFDPAADFDSLANELQGRRVTLAAPEESLLLLKPSGVLPHGGGQLIEHDSPEYRTLRRWIEQRVPRGKDDLSDMVRIEAAPRDLIVGHGDQQQLRVVLHYTDGKTRDITAAAEYHSQRPEFLDVDRQGLVKIQTMAGEGTVFVRYLSMVDIVRFSVPFSGAVPADAYAGFQPVNVVDEHVLSKWRTLCIVPSELATDQEFIRRLFLDCIGRLPESQEVRTFLADTAADKRDRLIESLFARPEFADFWAVQLGDVLQNRRERDKKVWGPKGVRAFHEWLRQKVATNRPWSEIARDVLTVVGDTSTHPTVGYYIVAMGNDNDAEQTELVPSIAQAFLGTRLGCARCHNHPWEKYTQDDFFHFAAFFSRVRMDRKDADKEPTKLYLKPPQNDPPTIGVRQPRTGQWMEPRTLDGQVVKVEKTDDPRHNFAVWATDPKNEIFSGAMVNRLVRHFLGYGLVEPVDDLRATNPPTNPQLWAALNKEFVEHGFDLRHLMRLLVRSRTYQLSATTRAGNEADHQFYSHYTVRRLPAEVLLDAISQATGVPAKFTGYPLGIRAMQMPDNEIDSYFLASFGRPPRNTACACEREGAVSLPQVLHLQNGEQVVQAIADPKGRLASLRAATNDPNAAIEELFLVCLARLPEKSEIEKIQAALGGSEASSGDGLTDLFWALLNSKEFCFNH